MITQSTSFEDLSKSHQQFFQSMNAQELSSLYHNIEHESKSKKNKMEWLQRESRLRVLDMERQLEITKSEWAQVDRDQFDHEEHARYTMEQDKLQFNLQTELKQCEQDYNNLIEEKKNLEKQIEETQVQINFVPPVSEEACILSIYHGLGIHFDPDSGNTDSLNIPVKSVYLRNSALQQAILYHIEPEDSLETLRDFFWSSI